MSLLWGALILMVNEVPTDLVMLSFTVLLVLTQTISNQEAWVGFASTSVLSIGALFIVARCLEETRAIEVVLLPILGNPSGHVSALIRLCVPVALLSAFLNNTPIVAMLIGVCEGWAARSNLSIKVLLIPLSFSAMLGGMCTLIGTSTNLVLNSQIENDPNAPLAPLTMFDLTPVGAPAAVAGIIYIVIATPLIFRSMPEGESYSSELRLQAGDRLIISGLAEAIDALRRFDGVLLRPGAPVYTSSMHTQLGAPVLVEATLATGSSLVGMPLARALESEGLRGTDVWAIRQGPRPRQLFEPRDAALPSTLMRDSSTDLQIATTLPTEIAISIDATQAPAQQVETFKHGPSGKVWYKATNVLFELSQQLVTPKLLPFTSFRRSSAHEASAPAAERALDHGNFDQRKHGGTLRSGDTLLLEAPDSWIQANRSTHYFVRLKRVVAAEDAGVDEQIYQRFKLILSVVGLAVMLTLSATGTVNLFPLALTVAAVLISAGCITMDQAWRAINYRLLITIAMAFGPGEALGNTHVSAFIGTGLAELIVLGPFGFLLCIFLITSLMSCVVSHAAAVVTLYTVLSTLDVDSISSKQMMIVMVAGASCTFATPLGYQTNLMVLGRGGYAFSDFFLLGGGLTIITGCAAAASCMAFVS